MVPNSRTRAIESRPFKIKKEQITQRRLKKLVGNLIRASFGARDDTARSVVRSPHCKADRQSRIALVDRGPNPRYLVPVACAG